MGLDGGMICAINFFAVFALNGHPIFLVAGVVGAMFADIVVEHLKLF